MLPTRAVSFSGRAKSPQGSRFKDDSRCGNTKETICTNSTTAPLLLPSDQPWGHKTQRDLGKGTLPCLDMTRVTGKMSARDFCITCWNGTETFASDLAKAPSTFPMVGKPILMLSV